MAGQLMSEERCIHSWFRVLLTIESARSPMVGCGVVQLSGRSGLPFAALRLTPLSWPAQPESEAFLARCSFVSEAKDAFAKGEKSLIFRDSKHLQTLPLLPPVEALRTAQFCPLLSVPSCTFRIISCLMNSVSSVWQCRVFYSVQL